MFCKRLKKLRVDRNIKQGKVADGINVSQRVLSGLERGETQPTLKQIEAICLFFNVTSDFIINGNDVSFNAEEIDIINVLRNDKGLLNSLMKIVKSRKEVELIAA